MSEYQYCEFQAIDHQLTAAQMNLIRRSSSRAQISPVRFVNTYNHGDFRDDPDDFIHKWLT
jgi:hypothetical protein